MVVVRWIATPTIVDAERLLTELSSVRVVAGAPLCSVAVVSPDQPLPSIEVRNYMTKRWPDLVAQTERMYFLVEGDGVKVTLLRSFLRTMVVMGRVRVTILHRATDALAELRPFLPTHDAAGRVLESLKSTGSTHAASPS